MFHVDEYVLNELAGALNDRYKCGKGMKGNHKSAHVSFVMLIK